MEIHDSLSPAYRQFYYNNKYRAIIGLSATVDRNTSYYDEEEGEEYTKGDLLDSICPVIYTYGIAQGQEEGTVRPLKLYVVYTSLDALKKTIEGGSKAKPFMQTEAAAYAYWTKALKRSMIKGRMDFRAVTKRKKIIQESLGKSETLKKLVALFEENGKKTIVFAKFVAALSDICEVISYKSEHTLSDSLNRIDSGEILTLGNCKMLQQGISIPKLDICILHSYDGKPKGFIQSVGRLRQDGDKLGTVVVLVTRDTKETDWFTGMTKGSGLEPIICRNFEEFEREWKLEEEK